MICVAAAPSRSLTCRWALRRDPWSTRATAALGLVAPLASPRYDGWYGKVDLMRPKRSLGAAKDDEHMPLGM